MHFFAITGGDIALIVTALAGLVTAVAGAIAILLRKTPGQSQAQRSATAVSTIVQTKDQVDALVGIVADLQNQLTKLKALREMDRQKIIQLQHDLETEQDKHAETRRLLDIATIELGKKDKLISDLQQQLDKLGSK